MADSNRSAVTAVAIIAIVILVALVAYFVMEETDDTIDVDLGQVEQEAPAGQENRPDLAGSAGVVLHA